jgi:electron-transferring-flavoprotein dehydrogenase
VEDGGIRVPNLFMPPLMSNHGCYTGSLGALCRWLGEQAEALGVEIYPGFSVVDVIFGKSGEIEGVITGDMGVARDGSHKDNYTPGIAIVGKYSLFAEGARARSPRCSSPSSARRRVGPAEIRHRPEGAVGGAGREAQAGSRAAHHGLAARRQDRRRLLPLSFRRALVSVGFVLHLDYSNPYLNPFKEFQRAKTHPLIAEHLDGGKRIAYGARALTEGGYQAIPQLAFPGGALIGCAAGFMNVPRIKGSHNAMLSG